MTPMAGRTAPLAFTHDLFRSHVRAGAHHGGADVPILKFPGRAVIQEFDRVVGADHNVIGFDITMHNLEPMGVRHHLN